MNIHPIIQNRYSPRAFSEQPIPEDYIAALFEAARWAPSARNEQPWRFYFYQNTQDQLPNPLLAVLSEWNQKWAQSAPLIVAAVAKLNFEHKNLPNAHALYDLGQAVAALTFQASALGLFVHQMGGFSKEKATQLLKLDEGFEVITILVVGYKGDLSRIPSEYHADEQKVRERKSMADLVFKAF